MNKNNSNNKIIISLLAVLIIAVLGVGGYFVIKDATKKQEPESSQNNTNNNSSSNQNNSSSSSTPSNVTPAPEPVQEEIEAGITYAEIRGNDFYIEAQVNGAPSGTCEISLVPTNGGQGHHETDELDVENKISVCDEDFSLKGLNRGEHKITVVIRTTDGREKTLEKIVNI